VLNAKRAISSSHSLSGAQPEIDALTAEVAGALNSDGIETLVLKGPVLAKWLYPEEVRAYSDSDLLVATGSHAHAVEVLERARFHTRGAQSGSDRAR
jgi:hypothetical protein